jgi:hypothetical protein
MGVIMNIKYITFKELDIIKDGSLFIFRLPTRCSSDILLRHLTLPEILGTLSEIPNISDVTVFIDKIPGGES